MWNETVDLLIFAYSIVSVILVEEWYKFTDVKEKDKPSNQEFIIGSIAMFFLWPVLVICAMVSMIFKRGRY